MALINLYSILVAMAILSSALAWTLPAGGAAPPTGIVYKPNPVIHDLLTAHAVTMSAAFLILFPVGAMLVRLGVPVVKVHLPLEITALALAVAGVGVGIKLANETNHSLGNYAHTIIGLLVVFSLLAFQPLIGWMQHRHFHRYHGRGIFGFIHLWFGRVMVILGMVNGGIGFALGWQQEMWRKKSYVSVASVVGFCWVAIWVLNAYRNKGVKDLIGLMPKGRSVVVGRGASDGEDGDKGRESSGSNSVTEQTLFPKD